MKICYIPLDDRPICHQRVIYMAKEWGAELVMPPKSTVTMRFDCSNPLPDGRRFGDREALKAWLENIDARGECDIYIISIDQLLSGGLAASRILTGSDLSFEYGCIDLLERISKRSRVLAFDTVKRLAATCNFYGHTLEDYYASRKYGLLERKQFSGEELCVANIISALNTAPDGSEIKSDIPAPALADYLSACTRKLLLNDYLLDHCGDFECLLVGVDDSSPMVTVQTNIINYLSRKAGDTTRLMGGTDELAMVLLARACCEKHSFTPKLSIAYYGGGKDLCGEFAINTVEKNFLDHVEACKAEISDDSDMEILILTKKNVDDFGAEAEKLLAHARKNFALKKPTAVIDCSVHKNVLQDAILAADFPVSMLLGFSSWNTDDNSIGIALGESICRLSHLLFTQGHDEEADKAFLSELLISVIKEFCYKSELVNRTKIKTPPAELSKLLCSGELSKNVPLVTEFLTGKPYIASLSPYAEGTIKSVCADNFFLPWERPFEMEFDIHIDI